MRALKETSVLVREVESSGERALDVPGAPSTARLAAWASTRFPANAQPLGLSVDDIPEPVSNPLLLNPLVSAGGSTGVALLTDYQPTMTTVVSWGKPVPIADWTSAMQQAIDSGKPIVVLPPGRRYFMQGEVIVRGAVRLIDCLRGGLHEIFHGSGTSYRCTWVIADGAGPVELRGLRFAKANCTVAQRSSRTLVLRDLSGGTYAGAMGTVHVIDSNVEGMEIATGQRAFLHGVCLENGQRTLITNHGGDLWGLGISSVSLR